MNLKEIKSVKELEDFAVSTVLLDVGGNVWQKLGDGNWYIAGDDWATSSEALRVTCCQVWLLATAGEIKEVIG